MMERTVRTAISLPIEDFKAMEAIRKRTHRGRSEILKEALRQWLKRLESERCMRRYEEGYRKHPEDHREIEAFSEAGLEVMAKEKW